MQRGPRFGIQNTLLLNLGTHVVVIIPASWSSLINYLPKTEMLPCMQTQPRHVSPSFSTFSSKVFFSKAKVVRRSRAREKIRIEWRDRAGLIQRGCSSASCYVSYNGKGSILRHNIHGQRYCEKISGECVSAFFLGGSGDKLAGCTKCEMIFSFFFPRYLSRSLSSRTESQENGKWGKVNISDAVCSLEANGRCSFDLSIAGEWHY